MFLSVIWIYLSCVVVLNLLIALMADSYSRIFEKAELFARIDRARWVPKFQKLNFCHLHIVNYSRPVNFRGVLCSVNKVDLIFVFISDLNQIFTTVFIKKSSLFK